MKWNSDHWRRKIAELQRFIEPLVADLGRSERRESAALYVQGLLMPGQRKSIEPMAERLRVDSQKLQQFISGSPWLERRVWQAIRREVIPVVEPLQAWVVDETGWLKQGKDSVGVEPPILRGGGQTGPVPGRCRVSGHRWRGGGAGGRAAVFAGSLGQRLAAPEKAGVPNSAEFQPSLTSPAI